MKIYLATFLVSILSLVASLSDAKDLSQGCDMTSEKTVLACVQAKADEIDEANLPNEIIFEKSKAAREDMLMLLAPYEGRNDSYARDVMIHEAAIAKALYFGVVVQYEDEPRLHYFYVARDGQFSILFVQNTVDLSGLFPNVKDLATYTLHAIDLSQSLQESVAYSYQDEKGLSVECDISEEREVAKYYAGVLKADESSPSVRPIAVNKISEDVLRCTDTVEMGFELGDGYYDVVWSDWLAVYGKDDQTIEGYLARFGMTYTEAHDPSQVEKYIVRFNRLGQRISKVGEY